MNEDNFVVPRFTVGDTLKSIIDLKKKSTFKRVPTPTDPRSSRVPTIAEYTVQKMFKTDGGFLVRIRKFDKTSDLYPFAIRVTVMKLELLSLIRDESYMSNLARELSLVLVEKLSLEFVFRRSVTGPLAQHLFQTLRNNLPRLLVDMNYEKNAATWTLYIGAFRFVPVLVVGDEPVINTESKTVFEFRPA
jgi:hypothetical protein